MELTKNTALSAVIVVDLLASFNMSVTTLFAILLIICGLPVGIGKTLVSRLTGLCFASALPAFVSRPPASAGSSLFYKYPYVIKDNHKTSDWLYTC